MGDVVPAKRISLGPSPAAAEAAGFVSGFRCRQCQDEETSLDDMTTHLVSHLPAEPGYDQVYIKVS